ncbi:MAG: enoyl-CoA hydratase/isomerase family protein [Actinobacteria bacterium]|nr:enoyl-CoA hydratase/isomerase family protein [Actinomycetota bacterium]
MTGSEALGVNFDTLSYEEADGVAWVTLNRPEVHNAFNLTMQRELRWLWRKLRHRDPVRAIVLTGAGDKAFCTGIDRSEAVVDYLDTGQVVAGSKEPHPAGDPEEEPVHIGVSSTPFHFDDPSGLIGPKSNDLWKPVIAAVNGMACGGAFYMLGEAEFIIAADVATFFDPHVSFGMAAAFEPIHMLGRMPFGEVMRMSLLGNHERLSARRALEIGLVSEVVPLADLHDAASWAAGVIASQPALSIEGTVRAVWAGRELSRTQALGVGFAFAWLGTSNETLAAGQQAFAAGPRAHWKLR